MIFAIVFWFVLIGLFIFSLFSKLVSKGMKNINPTFFIILFVVIFIIVNSQFSFVDATVLSVICSFLINILIISVIIKFIFQVQKKAKEDAQKQGDADAKTSTQSSQNSGQAQTSNGGTNMAQQEPNTNKFQEKRRYFCEYCGNELLSTDRKCPSCGARRKYPNQ